MSEHVYRERALKLYPWICARCGREFAGKNLRELTVHHKDHDHQNNPPDGSNWELLCLYCHDNEHSRQLEAQRMGATDATSPSGAPIASHRPFADLQDRLKGKLQPPPGRAGRPRVALIAAVAANGAIGRHQGLPWRLPEDLRRFKALTLGHPVIMGRRTWESIGRPLPGRENIVVTRSARYAAPGCRVAHSLDEALAASGIADDVFVIGGGDLYRAALPLAERLLLTEIRRDFPGDAFFPVFDRAAFRETSRAPQRAADGVEFDFVEYQRLPG